MPGSALGDRALDDSCRTLPAVSFPSSVVRSIIEIVSFKPATLVSFLMLRFVKEAARSSTITLSTVGDSKLG